MREWDIPFDELKIGEPIGTGRFGTVYRGNWHGDVAIKVLNMDYLDDEKTLEAFKLEVGVLIPQLLFLNFIVILLCLCSCRRSHV
jgi:serine/threonine protein kinase